MATPSETHRQFVNAWNERDFDQFEKLLHPQYSYTGADGQEKAGPAAGVAAARLYATAFPDARTEIGALGGSGNISFGEFTTTGTNAGPLDKLPATGKSVRIRRCNVIEIQDGLIYRERDYMDTMTLMSQLGIFPQTGSAHS